jgi:hypothetical protein
MLSQAVDSTVFLVSLSKITQASIKASLTGRKRNGRKEIEAEGIMQRIRLEFERSR